jgi:type VI secretion system secreted protein VgrG
MTSEATLQVAGEDIRVKALSLWERLDEIPTVTIEATNGQETPDAEDVIGKLASLTLRLAQGDADDDVRYFHGIVVEAERVIDAGGDLRLVLKVAPKLWRASQRRDCAQYQAMSAPDLAKKILAKAGIDPVALQLSGSYPARKWIVQYRESDLDFVRRLLAEEGIWLHVVHDAQSDKVVLCDDPLGAGDVAGKKSLSYHPPVGLLGARDAVTRVRRILRVRTDKAVVRDWDAMRPKLKLEGQAESSAPGAHALEVYEFPTRTVDNADVHRHAKVLLASLQADREVIEGEATVLTLAPGLRFEIEQHPLSSLDGEYLVTETTIEMRDERVVAEADDGARFVVRFTAIPTARVAYRPKRRPAARTAEGLQTALTTGAAGEEIHVDKDGRVKVKFPWDRVAAADDKSSEWFRTCQLPTGGAVFLPRVGWEVSVDFVEGDVDHPIVFQRLYNVASPPPYALPANKARGSIQTASTPGGGSTNEFRMDDTKGKEEMFFNASKDMSIDVKNNATEAVKNNETRHVGSNHVLNVTNSVDHVIGASETLTVSGNQDVHVQTFAVDDVGGSHSLTIGANRNMMIGGDHKHEIKSGSTFTIGAIRTDLVAGAVSESTPATYSHTVGAACVVITTSNRSVIVGGPHTETIGALKVLVSAKARGVSAATLSKTIGGAILNKIGGDRDDKAEAIFSELAGGAQIVKANNVTYEADAMISLIMGASTLIITPASVMIAGVSVKIDGATVDNGIVIDN